MIDSGAIVHVDVGVSCITRVRKIIAKGRCGPHDLDIKIKFRSPVDAGLITHPLALG